MQKKCFLNFTVFVFGLTIYYCNAMNLAKIPSVDDKPELAIISRMLPLSFSFKAENGQQIKAVTNPVIRQGSDNAHTCGLYALYNAIVFAKEKKLEGCFTAMGKAKESFPAIESWKNILYKNGWKGTVGLNGKDFLLLRENCQEIKDIWNEKEFPADVTVCFVEGEKLMEPEDPTLWKNIQRFRSSNHHPQTIFIAHDQQSGRGHAYSIKLVWPQEGEPAMLIAETRLPESFELNRKHAKMIFDLFTSTPIPASLSQSE